MASGEDKHSPSVYIACCGGIEFMRVIPWRQATGVKVYFNKLVVCVLCKGFKWGHDEYGVSGTAQVFPP